MSDITVTAAKVAAVFEKFGKAEIYSHVAGATITKGDAVYIAVTTGLVHPTDANVGEGSQECQFRGIALTAGGAGQAIDVLMHGCVEGFTLSGNYDSLVYLSDNAGMLADAASGTNSVIVGRVYPLSDRIASTGYPNKVLFVDVDMAAANHSGT